MDSQLVSWSIESLFFHNEPKPVTAEKFEASWKRLGSSSPSLSLAAVNDLRNSVDQIFDLLAGKIGQPMTNSRSQIQQLILDLDGKSFKVREEATQKLISIRGLVERNLLETLEDSPSTEAQYRIARILKQPAPRPAIEVTDLRRMHRCVFLLELVSRNARYLSPTRELLQAIAQNHPHIDVARDAASSLERISILNSKASEE